MPRLVDEVGVAAHRVDLDAQGLEFGVDALEVGQFGRAHEGEVGGVEEDNVPFALEIVAGDIHEGP